MCGIVGYLGQKDAYPIILEGLQALEYRGYDSAGVALLNGSLRVYKKQGKVNNLASYVKGKNTSGSIGIGHTRWATHGEPSDLNSHPHTTDRGNLAMIHNGIIENYESLKAELISRGHSFKSETDSEVLVHLIEEIQLNNDCQLEKAVQLALLRVEGAYAIIVMSKDDPEKLVAARKSSPLVVGIGSEEFFISSDTSTMSKYVKKVVYLDDEQIAIIRSAREIEIKTVEDIPITPFIQDLDQRIDVLDKQGFEHYMLKEIYEQPSAIRNCMRGRVYENGDIHLKGVLGNKDRFKEASRIIIVSCGTSWHAGLVGEYLIEKYAKIPVEVEYASEFRYRAPIIHQKDIVIAISQSGETADTMAALEIAREKGAFTFGICNVVGSSISRSTDAGIYTKAGSEIGVASTKAFTTQMTVLAMMAIQLGLIRSELDQVLGRSLVKELHALPSIIKKGLSSNRIAELISDSFHQASSFIYLGRGANFPIALEGALKLKEISYIHAEGYPAAEMKHGPIALIDEKIPVVVVANSQSNYEKTASNIQEIKARKGKVIAVVQEDDNEVFKLADAVIDVPKSSDFLAPFTAVIPLQLISYQIANKLGKDVDQPRNLAKSVTVE